MTIGQRIKELRKQKGISRQQFQKETGIGTNTQFSWESDKTFPNAKSLELLADYYGVSIDYIMLRSPHVENRLLEVSEKIIEEQQSICSMLEQTQRKSL